MKYLGKILLRLIRVKKALEIEYIYHTNRLEGSYLMKWATERVLKGIPVKKFRSKDIVAAQNHSRAIKFVHRMASTPKYNITEADIKNIHFMISGHLIPNPRQYRTDDIDLTPLPSEIPKDMNKLVNFINKGYQKLGLIEKASCVHYQFSRIHPFTSTRGIEMIQKQ